MLLGHLWDFSFWIFHQCQKPSVEFCTCTLSFLLVFWRLMSRHVYEYRDSSNLHRSIFAQLIFQLCKPSLVFRGKNNWLEKTVSQIQTPLHRNHLADHYLLLSPLQCGGKTRRNHHQLQVQAERTVDELLTLVGFLLLEGKGWRTGVAIIIVRAACSISNRSRTTATTGGSTCRELATGRCAPFSKLDSPKHVAVIQERALRVTVGVQI